MYRAIDQNFTAPKALHRGHAAHIIGKTAPPVERPVLHDNGNIVHAIGLGQPVGRIRIIDDQ